MFPTKYDSETPSQDGDDLDPYAVACQISEQRNVVGKTLWIQDSGRSRQISRWQLLNPSDFPIRPLSNRICQILKKEFGISNVSQISETLLLSMKGKLKQLAYSDYQHIWSEVAATHDSMTDWVKVCKLGKGKHVDINQLAFVVEKALRKRHQQITQETGATISTEAFIEDLDLDDEELKNLTTSSDEIFLS